MQNKLHQAFLEACVCDNPVKAIHSIPVCYDEEFGVDLQSISRAKRLTVDQIIHLHSSETYHVHMLGFLPGFAYLGEISTELSMPRKENPVHVTAGSVGIVSNQTGIYPVSSPGGWQIVGRTPVDLFDMEAENPVKLKAGEKVRFYRISREEYQYRDWNR